MKKTFSELLAELQELRENCISDLKSDWIEEDKRTELFIQVQCLNLAIANLELIMLNPKSQLFNNIRL